jgi:hypothetical protein
MLAARHHPVALLLAVWQYLFSPMHRRERQEASPGGQTMQQLAFTLYMIVLAPGGGSPVVTNAGSWTTSAQCRTAAETAFMPGNQHGPPPSISFMCVPEAAEAMPDTK